MLFGYARVSTLEQNLDRQTVALKEAGCEVIYSDKFTGASLERPQLQKLLGVLKKEDTLIITDLTRFSRSTKDLFSLVEQIKEIGCNLKSLKDTWLDLSNDNPYSQFLLTVMAGVSQLERDITKMRQREGIEIAKKKGMYKGRPKQYTMKNERLAHSLDLYYSHQDTLTVKKVCAMTGIKEATFYRNWKVFKENKLGENGK